MLVSVRTLVLLLSLSLASGGAVYSVLSLSNPAPFAGDPGQDYGLDTNGNARYDWLVVDALVAIPTTGNWDLSASLISSTPPKSGDCGGSYPVPLRSPEGLLPEYTLSYAFGRSFLLAGEQEVRFAFNGTEIFRSGVDGPYLVRAAFTNSEGGYYTDPIFAPMPWPPYPGITWNATTQAYRASEFEEPVRPAYFVGTYVDVPVHVDEDGLYDFLEIRADIVVKSPGVYNVNGQLFVVGTDRYEGWQSIAWGYRDVRLDSRDSSVYLRFRGDQIQSSQLDGPWSFSLTLFGPNDLWFNGTIDGAVDGTVRPYPMYYPETLCGVTGAHGWAEFDDSMELVRYTGTFEEVTPDRNMNGLYDSLVIRAEVDVFLASGFDLEGTLRSSDGKTLVAASRTQTSWSEGPAWAEFVFFGGDIRGSGVDGPYVATLSITPLVRMIDPVAEYTTKAYRATDFEEGYARNLTYWISDMGYRSEPSGNASLYVTVLRGNDLLTYVIEDVIQIEVVDPAGVVVAGARGRVYLPSGGSSDTFTMALGGLPPGTYRATATLGPLNSPVDVRSIELRL